MRQVSPSRADLRSSITFADEPFTARFAPMRHGSIKPRFVAEFPNGRLWGRGYGYVVDAADALHADLSPSLDAFANKGDGRDRPHDGLRQILLPRTRSYPGTLAAIGTPYCENFHHWLLDAVPKFGVLGEVGVELDRLQGFLLPAGADCPWHREVLAMLNVGPSRIMRMNARSQIRAERLLAVSYSEPGREPERYSYTPEGLAFVRRLFARSLAPNSDLPRRIIVSRARAATRRWVQGNDGCDRLARAGFVQVRLEDRTLAGQAALFANADCVVMPTGGGLANLVFCRPGTRVVELFSPAYLPMFSAILAGPLHLDYRAIVGRHPSGVVGHSDGGGRDDIDVPVERVLEQCA
ncbi:MAG TPA: glycosyltransferase family 61 protein [Opitutaceae bacterium]|nr:glycosyltransferase family 61 protein [Opitutaceae bacterium]